MSIFAEFERAMIQARVRSGLARAKAQGKRLGRPRIDVRTEQRIRAALAKGDRGILKIAADLGVGSGTAPPGQGSVLNGPAQIRPQSYTDGSQPAADAAAPSDAAILRRGSARSDCTITRQTGYGAGMVVE
jgi:hypothetical protein